MKSVKIILKIAAAFAVLAGVLFVEQIRAKLPTKKAIFDKLPTKADMIRLNPFRKAEIEAEYADYADVD